MLAATPIRLANVAADDWAALQTLPWGVPLEAWSEAEHGLAIINQRRGLSRHPVLFVQAGGRKYAIKETSPEAAENEIKKYREITRRGCPALVPVGSVIVKGDAISVGTLGGVAQYVSGDSGYCITRLATRVLPHSLLYQFPFTQENKRLLLAAIARLLVTLHRAGVYWGDASLANVLVDLSRRRLLAVLADAETVELFPTVVSDALRQQDLEFFLEALAWQNEDIRLARDLPEDAAVLDESDAQLFAELYMALWRGRRPRPTQDADSTLWRLGSGVLEWGTLAWRAGVAGMESTFRPGWYRDQLRDLMGVWIPRPYARRVYELLLGHKWLMSEVVGRDVGLADAAADWRTRYHEPLVDLLATYAPGQPINYDAYLAIMQHIWQLSRREGHPIPIEEGAIDYLLPKA
jgi:hypothetical protein